MALRRLRHSSTSGFLWVDQLCIDQHNPDEKGPQIQLMKDIYRKAKLVVVWLGEDPGATIYLWRAGAVTSEWRADSALLADMLKIFAEAPNHTADDLELARRCVDVRPTYHLNTIQQHGLRVILEILKRPWFRRAWVFEEASLARELLMLYGPLEVRFEELKRLLDAVHSLEMATGIRNRRSIAVNTAGFEMLRFIDDSRRSLLASQSGETPNRKGGRLPST